MKDLVQVAAFSCGPYASPARWVECRGGQPTEVWDGEYKIIYVPAGTDWRMCRSNGFDDTRRSSWKKASIAEK